MVVRQRRSLWLFRVVVARCRKTPMYAGLLRMWPCFACTSDGVLTSGSTCALQMACDKVHCAYQQPLEPAARPAEQQAELTAQAQLARLAQVRWGLMVLSGHSLPAWHMRTLELERCRALMYASRRPACTKPFPLTCAHMCSGSRSRASRPPPTCALPARRPHRLHLAHMWPLCHATACLLQLRPWLQLAAQLRRLRPAPLAGRMQPARHSCRCCSRTQGAASWQQAWTKRSAC